MYFDGIKENKDVDCEFDYVIIGSGAGGATAARVLSEFSSSVAVLEEGYKVDRTDFSSNLYPMLKKTMRQMGGLLVHGNIIYAVLQGLGLGGSTIINSAIMYRIPDYIFDDWEKLYGLGHAFPRKELHQYWDILEKELDVKAVPEESLGQNNLLMRVAADKLGWEAQVMERAGGNCQGASRCLLGCPNDAKQALHLNLIPYAEKRGATFFTGAKVRSVVMENGRAVGVKGSFVIPQTNSKKGNFYIRAKKAVIVSASVIQTPGILKRSGIYNRHLGEHFQAHPGCALTATFDKPVNMWFGAMQGYDMHEFARSGPYKIESLAFPPEMGMVRLPGVGPTWKKRIEELPYTASWAVQMKASGRGRVKDIPFGHDIVFNFSQQDTVSMRQGIKNSAIMLFEAGAKSVSLGVYGLPDEVYSVDELKILDEYPQKPSYFTGTMSHLFGTCRMSNDPRDGVVDTNFKVHGTDNLYVLDGSVFPTNTGVNPQLPIMGLSWLGAKRVLENTK
ncbi:GMC family oxidoreductase [bacterium]|nr:GMC family oxidoreductase [bacterium]